MGLVIAFPQPAKANAPPRGNGQAAQILFYTGVRYQRMSEPAPGASSGASPSSDGGLGGKRKRKRG